MKNKTNPRNFHIFFLNKYIDKWCLLKRKNHCLFRSWFLFQPPVSNNTRNLRKLNPPKVSKFRGWSDPRNLIPLIIVEIATIYGSFFIRLFVVLLFLLHRLYRVFRESKYIMPHYLRS